VVVLRKLGHYGMGCCRNISNICIFSTFVTFTSVIKSCFRAFLSDRTLFTMLFVSLSFWFKTNCVSDNRIFSIFVTFTSAIKSCFRAFPSERTSEFPFLDVG
jgi:hypothetical protein